MCLWHTIVLRYIRWVREMHCHVVAKVNQIGLRVIQCYLNCYYVYLLLLLRCCLCITSKQKKYQSKHITHLSHNSTLHLMASKMHCHVIAKVNQFGLRFSYCYLNLTIRQCALRTILLLLLLLLTTTVSAKRWSSSREPYYIYIYRYGSLRTAPSLGIVSWCPRE